MHLDQQFVENQAITNPEACSHEEQNAETVTTQE